MMKDLQRKKHENCNKAIFNCVAFNFCSAFRYLQGGVVVTTNE